MISRSRRVTALAVLALVCFEPIPIARSEGPVDAADPDSSFASKLVDLARQSCLERGDRSADLSSFAKGRNWTPASDQELARHGNEFTRMLGGWLFSDSRSSYAILQSVMDVPRIHVCSITTKLQDGDFAKFKQEFETKFAVKPDEVSERPEIAKYRYWITRQDKSQVRATLVSTPAPLLLTIRMIHGDRLPPDV